METVLGDDVSVAVPDAFTDEDSFAAGDADDTTNSTESSSEGEENAPSV